MPSEPIRGLDPVDAPPGRPWCQARTAAVDEAVGGWMEASGSRGGAVVALGGYARHQLCPASDVDLLLLHDGWGRRDLEALVQTICYPLWDAGLTVGYAVHRPADALRKAKTAIDSATALVDRRLISGDPGLADRLAAGVSRWLRQNASWFLGELAAADRARRGRSGERPGMLEPDLKDGAGGLRDLASLRWAAAALLGEARLDRLVGARYIGAAEYRELAQAEEVLLAARCGLQLTLGARRPGASANRLRLDLQDQVGDLLDLGGGDELLQQVGLAMRTVAHTHARVWPRLLADAASRRRRRPSEPLGGGLRLVDGLVEVDDDRPLAREPALGLQAAAAAARHNTHFGRVTAARLRADAERARLPWTNDAREALLGVLRQGPRARGALADLDHTGLLVAHLRDWGRVRGRPQRNPYHRFDLDTHLVETVAELIALVEAGGEPAQRWSGLDRQQQTILLLAALLHDIGKAWEGDHSEQGAAIAQTWVTAMGFPADVADGVAWLVRHHLLLPETATRRNIQDPAEVAALVAVVRDEARLDGLYLLALADARATGPAAHSPWKDLLITELRTRARAALAGEDEPAVGDTGPPTPAALLVGAVVPGELRAMVEAGPAAGTLTVHVVAHDRPGLLADCAGVLASHGVSVLDAWAVSRQAAGPTAVDRFVVNPPADVDWQQVLADLADAGAGRFSVEAAVQRMERRSASRPDAHADVRVEPAGDTLRVEVRAVDGPGLLYRLARALTDAEVDIVGARAETRGADVLDIFFVKGSVDAVEAALRPRESQDLSLYGDRSWDSRRAIRATPG